ncbi:MAG: hypothetical protein O2908_02310 [Verrucomicrobia bacterium]|nr:hypothetical protein [Verrucomicrobiota bacterium]
MDHLDISYYRLATPLSCGYLLVGLGFKSCLHEIGQWFNSGNFYWRTWLYSLLLIP